MQYLQFHKAHFALHFTGRRLLKHPASDLSCNVLVTSSIWAERSAIRLHPEKSIQALFSSNMPQWRHSFLLTAQTLPPSEPVSFILCPLLWDEPNPQSHWLILSRWRMAFSAAYQMSPGSSVVVAAIQRGWIALIKAIFALLNSAAEVSWWHLSALNLETREASNKVADTDMVCLCITVHIQGCIAV